MIETAEHDGVKVLALGARYDSLDEDALEELGGVILTAAAVAEPPRLVLDMSATDLIGSRFIELLIRAWRQATERSGTLVLCGVQPFCLEVLKITRLDTLWTICGDRAEAVAAAKDSPA